MEFAWRIITVFKVFQVLLGDFGLITAVLIKS